MGVPVPNTFACSNASLFSYFIVKTKCWYYETAKAAGTIEAPQKMDLSEVPERFRKIRQKLRTAPGAFNGEKEE